MNAQLTPFFAAWIALACGVAGLAIYRRVVATHEDDMLHVSDSEARHAAEQAIVGHRLDAVDHWGKILTVVVAVYGVLLAAAYAYQTWTEGFSKMWE
jgi:hypothetical protein